MTILDTLAETLLALERERDACRKEADKAAPLIDLLWAALRKTNGSRTIATSEDRTDLAVAYQAYNRARAWRPKGVKERGG